MVLSQICPGERVEILQMPECGVLTRHLRRFGIVVGSQLVCRYFSPGKDLVAVEYGGGVLALRVEELTQIRVRLCQ